jgi:hypothetical protein
MARSRNDHLKFQVYRGEAFRQALGLLIDEQAQLDPPAIDCTRIKIEPITRAAIEASFLWGDGGLYPWEDVLGWKKKSPKGIDIALWFDQELCGMCYATPRDSKITIKVILLEGKDDKTHPLKGYVLPLSMAIVDSYARMIQCQTIEIQEPDPGCVAWYQENGFDYDDERRLVISVQSA